jgi:hypothetical protein
MLWDTIRKKHGAVIENSLISVYFQPWKVKEETVLVVMSPIKLS